MFAIDHLAFPCFDVAATSRFYTEILGATLRHAQSGPAEAWNAREYLLLAFQLPGGLTIDFFSFDGIRRPETSLPKGILHVALVVPTRAEVMRFQERFVNAEVPLWLETHEVDDVHVYVADPNGVTIELLAAEDGMRARERDADGAQRIVERWMAARG
jgi:glyoxylase I family protein